MSHFIFLLISLLLCLAAGVQSSPATPLKVEAARIELDPENPGGQRFGDLIFLSGFELASKDSRFGGLSGLALSNDGNLLYAVSDRGYWLSVRLHHNSKGRLTGLSSWEMAPLLTPEGNALSRRLRDAEALVRDRDGSFIVAFERNPRLWRYPASREVFTLPPQSLPLPPDLSKAPSNGGLEAVAILPDRRFLLLTERYKNQDGSLKGWLMEKDRFSSLSYLQSDGFQPTDISTLPGGDLLLLERRYNLLRGAVVRVQWLSGTSIRTGARLKGKEIALLAPPLAVDNFEGLAVRTDPSGGTLLYMISDDNYSPLQRTLLLQFRLINTTQ